MKITIEVPSIALRQTFRAKDSDVWRILSALDAPPPGAPLAVVEAWHIRRTVASLPTNGEAADCLGIHRATLSKKIAPRSSG